MADVISTPLNADLTTFRAVLAAQGELAAICRFVVRVYAFNAAARLDMPDIWFDLCFLCESAELPGRGLETVDIRYYGPKFKMPIQSAYSDINLTFLVRQDMLEKELFDQWMNVIHPPNSYNFSYRKDYETRIDIFSIDNIGDATYNIQLQEAYPVNVAPMQTNWGDENWHRIQVQFAYTNFTHPGDVRWPKHTPFDLVPGPKRADGGPNVVRSKGSTIGDLARIAGTR
jgi:hypothetical protein